MADEEKSTFHARPSILASVEGSHLVQAVNPKFLDWLLEVEAKITQLEAARDKLYEALPTGEMDAFALIKIIKTHIEDLDKILEAS